MLALPAGRTNWRERVGFFGSSPATRRNYLSVRCVPFSAPTTRFSVSSLEGIAGKKTRQGDGGLIDRVTGLRVIMTIVEIAGPVETQFTNIKPASIKRLGEDYLSVMVEI
jgi:hypothetical protein